MAIAIENPPDLGEYRVFNQLDEVYGVHELAGLVFEAATRLGIRTRIEPLENAHVEMEDHYYNVDHEHLHRLGFRPTGTLDKELDIMLNDLLKCRTRIEAKRAMIRPKAKWRRGIPPADHVLSKADRAQETTPTIPVG